MIVVAQHIVARHVEGFPLGQERPVGRGRLAEIAQLDGHIYPGLDGGVFEGLQALGAVVHDILVDIGSHGKE